MLNDINHLDSRISMGLSKNYSPSSIENLHSELDVLSCSSIEELVTLVQSRHHDKVVRYAAGTLLALRGDPRIIPLDPPMVIIPEALATLGLEPERVDAVVEQYRSFGVVRDWIVKECPTYQSQISSFKIGRYCVSNLEYRDFLLDSGHTQIPSSWDFGAFPIHRANHPVFTVAPGDAETYCQWLNAQSGRRFRLPTEPEWEYVAGGKDHYVFPWGDDYALDHANTIEELVLSTTPIGMYPLGQSPFGVMDMAGNVEEYTADHYRPYPNGEIIIDDLAIAEGQYRIARGGSFTRFRDLARTTRRHGWFKKDIYCMGFRLAEDLFDHHLLQPIPRR
jgi:formylglycine-generating enzyme required for sulfatase activity